MCRRLLTTSQTTGRVIIHITGPWNKTPDVARRLTCCVRAWVKCGPTVRTRCALYFNVKFFVEHIKFAAISLNSLAYYTCTIICQRPKELILVLYGERLELPSWGDCPCIVLWMLQGLHLSINWFYTQKFFSALSSLTVSWSVKHSSLPAHSPSSSIVQSLQLYKVVSSHRRRRRQDRRQTSLNWAVVHVLLLADKGPDDRQMIAITAYT